MKRLHAWCFPILVISVISGAFLTGCYRFEREEEALNTVPVTNNPHIIQDESRNQSALKGIR